MATCINRCKREDCQHPLSNHLKYVSVGPRKAKERVMDKCDMCDCSEYIKPDWLEKV